MFNCANVAANQASSYYKLDDHYHEKGRVAAHVMGSAAGRLGLAGKFDSSKFNAALAGNFDSDIESANTPSPQRAGYDCVFSAPKSVSIEALVFGEVDVVEAHEHAVEAAMKEVQDLARARVTVEFQTIFVKSEIAYFGFLHETSRNIDGELPDPNLHIHNVILKQVLVKDKDGNEKLYALSNDEIYKAQKMLDAIYKQVLASGLRQIGYRIELTKDSFEIAGYRRADIAKLSKRTHQVDSNLAEKGLTRENSSVAQRDIAALTNRNCKTTFRREEMRLSWKEQCKDFQRQTRGQSLEANVIPLKSSELSNLAGSARQAHQGKCMTAGEAVAQAISHFAERDVKIKNAYVLAEVSIKLAEFTVGIRGIREAIDEAIANGELVLGRNGEVLAIGEAHRNEVAITEQYRAGQGRLTAAATKAQVATSIQETERQMTDRTITYREARLGRALFTNEIDLCQIRLDHKQELMVQKIATSSDRFNIIIGDAGAGRSMGIEVARQILETHGFTVKGLAPSGTTKALEDATIDTKSVKHALNNPEYWDRFDNKTVIILDEASLLDTRTMRMLQERATNSEARIAVVGDFRQNGTVERGSPLRQLAGLAKQADALLNLDEVQPGRHPEMRELHFAARDKPEASLDMMLDKWTVTAISDDKERLEAIAQMYVSMGSGDIKNAVIVTGKNVDRIQINEAIRAKLNLRGKGKISSLEMIDTTAEVAKKIATYECGDYIKFRQKCGSWKAGAMLQVVAKTPDGLTVKDGKGDEATINPRDFRGAVSIGQTEQIDIAPGERIRFTATNKSQKVLNGERATVIKIEDGKASIALDSGAQIIFSLDKNAAFHLRYAYAQTGYSAQEATARMFAQQGIKPNVILFTNSGDATVDTTNWYTNLTCTADKRHIVTNATAARLIENVRKAITHSKEKDMAEKLLNGTPEPQSKHEDRSAYIAPVAGDKAWQRIELPSKATTAVITEILNTAQVQYGRDLSVSGPPKYQTAVAKIAGRGEMNIKFDNVELDKIRKAATREGAVSGLKNAFQKVTSSTPEVINRVKKLDKLAPMREKPAVPSAPVEKAMAPAQVFTVAVPSPSKKLARRGIGSGMGF